MSALAIDGGGGEQRPSPRRHDSLEDGSARRANDRRRDHCVSCRRGAALQRPGGGQPGDDHDATLSTSVEKQRHLDSPCFPARAFSTCSAIRLELFFCDAHAFAAEQRTDDVLD